MSFTRLQIRRDTAASWTSENPVLADGELGFDKTNKVLKIGDGTTAWDSLPAHSGLVTLEDIAVNGAPEGSGVYVQDGEYVPAMSVVGGPVEDVENTGVSIPRVLTGTEVQYGSVSWPVGTLRFATDYPNYRLGMATTDGVAVDEFTPILMIGDPIQLQFLTQDGATEGQVLTWTEGAWSPQTPSASGGATGGPVATSDPTKVRHGTFSDWESSGETILSAELYEVDGVLYYAPATGAYSDPQWDEGDRVYTEDNPPAFANISGTLPLTRLDSGGASTGNLMFWNGTSWTFADWAFFNSGSSRVSFGAGSSPSAKVHVKSASSSEVGLIVQGAASQTANLQQWQDNSGNVVGSVAPGAITSSITNGSTTYSQIYSYGTSAGVAFKVSNGSTGYIQFQDGYGFRVDSTHGGQQYIHQGFGAGSGHSFRWSSSTSGWGTADTSLVRVAAGIVGIRNGSTGGGALSLIEQTAPGTPAANGLYLYAEDDGAGKTRLMVKFPSGVAKQVAIDD